jgi:lipopolysaccharide transport system ATP-binding protein
MIELGAGFNPILSGRENIYNRGAVLGFSNKSRMAA